MAELKEYLNLEKQVRSDKHLMAMIETYESTTQQLSDLLQNPDYDAAEAIRLTNDAEYLSAMISENPLYRAYIEARDAAQKAMSERLGQLHGCECNCAACQSQSACSNRRGYEGNA